MLPAELLEVAFDLRADGEIADGGGMTVRPIFPFNQQFAWRVALREIEQRFSFKSEAARRLRSTTRTARAGAMTS